MAIERRRVFYSGHVQGVGFRATTNRLARSFPVGGFVRNLPDGRVELLAQGHGESIAAFLRAIDEALGPHIEGVESRAETPDDRDAPAFLIRYDRDGIG